MAPKETKINTYAKVSSDQQRVLWYVMILSVVDNFRISALKPGESAPAESQSVIWQAADACAKPFHPGSDNHGQLLRFVCFWIVYREGLKLLSKML